jgi:hypothetical protein
VPCASFRRTLRCRRDRERRLHDSGAAWGSIRSGDIGAIGMPVFDGATIVIYSQLDARGFGPADGH